MGIWTKSPSIRKWKTWESFDWRKELEEIRKRKIETRFIQGFRNCQKWNQQKVQRWTSNSVLKFERSLNKISKWAA